MPPRAIRDWQTGNYPTLPPDSKHILSYREIIWDWVQCLGTNWLAALAAPQTPICKFSQILLHKEKGYANIIGSLLHFLLEVISTDRHFGHYVRILHWCTDQRMTHALMHYDLTASQGRILGYIAHRKTAPCSRDIEDEFNLSHPTVSGLLSRLEKKDFIQFCPDETDRRCKRIYLLPKGKSFTERIHRTIQETETQMVQNFTEEEKEQFFRLLNRAITNMGGDPCPRHKEEPTK